MPQLAEFQFFNTKRLTELYEKEHAYEQHKAIMTTKEANLKGQVSSQGSLDELRGGAGFRLMFEWYLQRMDGREAV
jgi:hypothetical protein